VTTTTARGREAEAAAERWLESRGLALVMRNHRCRGGEIDLVMRDGSELVFVEVRLRTNPRFGDAAASVTPAKQQRLIRAAQDYLVRHRWQGPCRFDLVGFDADGAPTWLRDVIQVG
jgi:putative endonuclease